jgi:hypothetical protein
MTWEPIETAPKDGSEILVFWMADFSHVGGPLTPTCQVVAWMGKGEEACWVDPLGGSEEGLRPISGEPTHWMPLPDPPTEAPR